LVDDEVLLADMQVAALGLLAGRGGFASLADGGVLQRLVEVEVGDGVAELVRLGVVVPDLARPLEVARVLAGRILLRDLEELLEGLVLDPPHPLRRDGEPALLVLLEIAFLEEHLEDLREILVVAPFELAKDVVAVFEKMLGQTIERRLRGERRELLGTVPLAV